MKSSEQSYRFLAENAADLLWSTDMELALTFVGPSVEALLGYKPEELIGRNLDDLMMPGSAEVAARAWAQELSLETLGDADPDRSRLLALELARRDGSSVWAEVRATFLRDQDGKPYGLFGIVRDITEWKRLSEQLVQAQKLETVARLAGGVAHEFNNLMTGVIGFCDLLLDSPGLDSEQRVDVQKIRQSGLRAAALTQQLLSFSGNQFIRPGVLDLNSLVSEVVGKLRPLLGEQIQVVTDLEPGLGLAVADRAQMEQVLISLALNARDAMPDGGSLTFTTRNVTVDEQQVGPHTDPEPVPYVMLSVSDTGIGMSQETLAHIFEPFFSTKATGQGSGLGLSAVYGFIKQSHGHISVHSGLGEGTTFVIHLPKLPQGHGNPPLGPLGPQPGQGDPPAVWDETGVGQAVSARLRPSDGTSATAFTWSEWARRGTARLPGAASRPNLALWFQPGGQVWPRRGS